MMKLIIILMLMVTVEPEIVVSEPFPGSQTKLLECASFEALIEGDTGPGKTWVMVRDSMGLQYADTPLGKYAIEVPEYRGVIFRRESTQLSNVLDEMHEIYPDFGGKYRAQKRGDPGPSFNFPSGAVIYGCHMKLEQDKRKHQGKPYQYVGFDELTHFLYSQYMYLFTRCRSKVPGLFPRIRGTANPEGEGIEWVRARFIETLGEDETAYFVKGDTEENMISGIRVPKGTKGALSRTCIRARLEENLVLQDHEGYRAQIAAMGEQYERALLHHDWYAFRGIFFKEFDNEMLVEPYDIPDDWELVGSLDPGFSSPLSFGLQAKDFEGNIHRIGMYYEKERSPKEHAEGINQFIENNPYTKGRRPSRIVAGHDAWSKQDRFSVVPSETTVDDIFRANNLYLTKAMIDRKQGWWILRGTMRQRKLRIFKDCNAPLVKQLRTVNADEKDPEDIKGKGKDVTVEDHALDEFRYGSASMFTPREIEAVQPESQRMKAVKSAKRRDPFNKF